MARPTVRSGPSRTRSAIVQTRRVTCSRLEAPADRTSSRARSTSARITRARSARTRPAGVSSAPRGRAIEERDAQVPLQRTDLLRERRSGDVQPARGSGEAPLLGHGEEVPELAQVHRTRYRRDRDRAVERVRRRTHRPVVLRQGARGGPPRPRYEYLIGVVPRPVEQPVRSWLGAARYRAVCRGADMRSHQAGELLLAETAASAGTTSERAQALLEVLRRVVPFDGAWLALADPLGHGYHSLATVDLDARTVEFLSGPHDRAGHRGHRHRPGTSAAGPIGPALSGRGASDLGRVPDPGRDPRGAGRRPVRTRRAARRLPRSCCPAAGSHRPRPPAAGSGGSRRCSRTASTRCVRWSPPRAWSGGPRPAWCSARTAAARRCRACRRMRC